MDELIKIIGIGAGGAGGAIARHLINISPLAKVFAWFPLPTFLINILGSFLIGLLLVLFVDRVVVSEALRLAVIVGFVGAFTTFSTFEIEVLTLLREKQTITAVSYVALSVIVGLAGVYAGTAVAKRF